MQRVPSNSVSGESIIMFANGKDTLTVAKPIIDTAMDTDSLAFARLVRVNSLRCFSVFLIGILHDVPHYKPRGLALRSIPRIDQVYAHRLKILPILGCNCHSVHKRCRRNEGITLGARIWYMECRALLCH